MFYCRFLSCTCTTGNLVRDFKDQCAYLQHEGREGLAAQLLLSVLAELRNVEPDEGELVLARSARNSGLHDGGGVLLDLLLGVGRVEASPEQTWGGMKLKSCCP